ncbi:MAG: hypothetical protein ACYDBB_17350 [Armatimonadota bacterium]
MKHLLFLLAGMLAAALPACAGDIRIVAPDDTQPAVEKVGLNTYYAPHIARYREKVPDAYNYPIPQQPITRDTYMKWVEDSGNLRVADEKASKDHGPYTLSRLLPVLIKYAQTGDAKMGQACIAGLKHYDKWLRDEVKKIGWHSQFITEPFYIGLYAKILAQGGLLDPVKDQWFKDLVIFQARNLHVWGLADSFYRGPMYRAQSDGAARGLVAMWYPDIPEAKAWKAYATLVNNDWWKFKDIIPDDTGYLFGNLTVLVLSAYLRGDDEFFTHSEMRKVWDRLLYEISPDGAISPYGPHSGWNSTALLRIYMLELIAAKTGDGRYRYGAHKLMNYLLYQESCYRAHHQLNDASGLALAYFFADERIKPVPPSAGSGVLFRKELLHVPNKKAAEKYLGPLDPAPDKAQVDCAVVLTDKTVPSKLVLRSGWNPGDFFVLVDLSPGGQAPGILGMTRWGAGLAVAMNSKGASEEGRLRLEDLGGTAPLRHNTNPDLQESVMQEVTVPVFTDMRKATFTTVMVKDFAGFPVVYTREFVFIKNRFLLARDIAHFEEGFLARLSSVYNTQNVGPQLGKHWANTYFDELHAASFPQSIKNPPYDLLVYFAPRPDCRLQVIDRTTSDPRAYDAPAQLRYTWQGVAAPGSDILFTQVYYPHAPSLDLPRSNAPGAARPEDLMGMAGSDGIHILRDEPKVTVARLTFEANREEWVVCNPDGVVVTQGAISTDARTLYLDVVGGKVSSVSAVEATFATLNGQDLFRQTERKNVEK